jgi:hypothetical protein
MCTINFVEADVPHVAAERQRRRSLSAGRRLSDLEMLKKVRILFKLFMYIKESLFANNAHTWLVLFSLVRIHCNKIPIYVFLFWELRSLSPNFHIHVSVSDLYILPGSVHLFSCSRIGERRTIVGIYKSLTDT